MAELYEPQPYPKMVYHRDTGEYLIVMNAEEQDRLGAEWGESPPEQAPPTQTAMVPGTVPAPPQRAEMGSWGFRPGDVAHVPPMEGLRHGGPAALPVAQEDLPNKLGSREEDKRFPMGATPPPPLPPVDQPPAGVNVLSRREEDKAFPGGTVRDGDGPGNVSTRKGIVDPSRGVVTPVDRTTTPEEPPVMPTGRRRAPVVAEEEKPADKEGDKGKK